MLPTERFTARRHESTSFRYVGFDLKQTIDDIILSQEACVNNLTSIRMDESRTKEKCSNIRGTAAVSQHSWSM